VTPNVILTRTVLSRAILRNFDAEDVFMLTKIIPEHDVGPGVHPSQTHAIRSEKAGKYES
jgi:hypothetical protein